jgi:hypothetical protein
MALSVFIIAGISSMLMSFFKYYTYQWSKKMGWAGNVWGTNAGTLIHNFSQEMWEEDTAWETNK